MLLDWLPRVLVPAMVLLVLALFRRMAPPRSRRAHHRYDEMQAPEPLPTGIIGGGDVGLRDRISLHLLCVPGGKPLVGFVGRRCNSDAVCFPIYLVLFPVVRCPVNSVASHSLVFEEGGQVGGS